MKNFWPVLYMEKCFKIVLHYLTVHTFFIHKLQRKKNLEIDQNIKIFFSFFMQAYFRQGVALQYLGRHADALAAFASGLAQDPKSLQLLVGMVEAAMKSPLRGRLV